MRHNTLDTFVHQLGDDHPAVSPRPRECPTESKVFLTYLLHLSAIRCAMASWGQPLEAIVSALLLRDHPRKP